jgi:hypothetical protein
MNMFTLSYFITILCKILLFDILLTKTLARHSIDPNHTLYFTMVLLDVYHVRKCKLTGIRYVTFRLYFLYTMCMQ